MARGDIIRRGDDMTTAQNQFHALEIARVTPDTADAVRLTLRPPEAVAEHFKFRPGQHLVVRAMIDGREVRRTYSICSGPDDASLEVTVKRVDGGWFSNHANETLKAGATLEAMPPSGRFTLPGSDGTARTYLAIAAGSGITPIMAMIRHAMTREPGSRFVLVYGNRTSSSILFRQELDDLKDRNLGRLTVAHVLSRGDDDDVPLLAGRIDGERLKALVPKLLTPATIDQAFLCGPGSLIKDAMGALQEMGLARDKIHFEFFKRGDAAEEPRRTPATGRAETPQGVELVVAIDGGRHTVRMQPGETILEAALRAGLNAPYSCKGGMCCTCRGKLVDGKATMAENFSLEPWEMERGFILTCQARPDTARVAVDYDEMS